MTLEETKYCENCKYCKLIFEEAPNRYAVECPKQRWSVRCKHDAVLFCTKKKLKKK